MVQQFSWTDQYFTEEEEDGEDTEGGGEGDAVSGPLDMSAPLSTQRHPLLVVIPSLMGTPNPPFPLVSVPLYSASVRQGSAGPGPVYSEPLVPNSLGAQGDFLPQPKIITKVLIF